MTVYMLNQVSETYSFPHPKLLSLKVQDVKEMMKSAQLLLFILPITSCSDTYPGNHCWQAACPGTQLLELHEEQAEPTLLRFYHTWICRTQGALLPSSPQEHGKGAQPPGWTVNTGLCKAKQ